MDSFKFFFRLISLNFKRVGLVVFLFLHLTEENFGQQQIPGKLQLIIKDSLSRELIPVRIRLTQDNKVVKQLPEAAIGVMYGHWDHADGFGYQPDSSFYIDGKVEMELPPGQYHLSVSKGNEYLQQHHDLNIRSGNTLKKTYRMSRWINMTELGWYSGDNHIHVRRSPREDPLLLNWIQAEDIHAGVMLRMGDFWETYYAQYDWGEKGVYQKDDYFLTSGQEDPRTPELGHALGLGASVGVRFKNEYYLYDKVFDRLHELGGLTGYAHQASSFHGYRGLILDGLRGKVDVLEILQFCVSEQPLITDHYYHLLDLGIPLTAIAGSDFPWCGTNHSSEEASPYAQIGNVRFYTYTGQPFNYKAWKKSLSEGHTFVSSGPVIEFSINQSIPGEHLDVTKGTLLTFVAKAIGHASQVPLRSLEIVAHGKIIGKVSVGDPGQSSANLSLTLEIPVEKGMWVAARTFGDPHQAAHTTPIYISVDKGGFHNPQTAMEYLDLSEQYLKELEAELEEPSTDPEMQAWYYKAPLKERINETREIIDRLRKKYDRK